MASQGLFSIGGIASGLDTSGIIEQLLALERQPVQRLERRQEQLTAVKEAWGQVITRLSSLRAATDKISRADRFDGLMSLASSDADAVSVAASGAPQTGSLSFTVKQLARRMQVSSNDTFASGDATLGARTLVLEDADGAIHDLTGGLGGEATLDELIAAVNDADIGVRASALQVSAGAYQLVLDATDTGVANGFTVHGDTTGWTDPVATTQTARDAVLEVGGIDVRRTSNTIDDLLPGATITLRTTTTVPVEVTARRDVEGAVAATMAFTDALEGVLGTLDQLTRYDAETKEAGLLQGDASARRLVTSLRDAVSRPVAGLAPAESLASTLGISFSRTGALEVDEARIRQAFTDDFAGTAARLGRSGSTTSDAGLFLNATATATPGTYAVEVTQAATVARAVGTYVAPGPGEQRTLRIEHVAGSSTDVVLDESHGTAADAAAHIRDTLAQAGVTAFDVGADGGVLDIATVAYGSSSRFTLTDLDGGDALGLTAGEHTGTDVAGTIGGEPAVGVGRTLTGTAGAVEGLAVRVSGMPTDLDVTFSRGIVGELDQALRRAEGIDGLVERARQSVDRQVDIYQTRIDGFERRLISREATIRRQFVGMETMLGQLNAQGNWLGQQLAGLTGQAQR